MIDGFRFWDPAAWTQGHPYDAYQRMRQEAPVMWTKTDKNLSGFWSVTKYEDIKTAELAHKVFSSQRGSINMGVPEHKHWRPEKLVPAAYNSLINLDEPLHREMRMQQSEFFFNGKTIGKITDRTFGKSFLRIWLDENCSYPKVRNKLIGSNN